MACARCHLVPLAVVDLRYLFAVFLPHGQKLRMHLTAHNVCASRSAKCFSMTRWQWLCLRSQLLLLFFHFVPMAWTLQLLIPIAVVCVVW